MPGQETPYWKDWHERNGVAREDEGEFEAARAHDSSGPSRREFLRLAGFAVAGTALAGCRRAPVERALPLLEQPENAVPGRAYHYASVCGGCSAGCGLLIKTRDGRPIKLEGNPEHPLSQGGLCAVGQASLLGLYDRQRLREPLRDRQPASWSEVDQAIRAQLQALRSQGRAVRFLSGSMISPTTRLLLQRFLGMFPNARHIVHDARPASAILDAHLRTHGSRSLPHYRLEQADVIVGIDADFLGTWISPVEFTAAYRKGRQPQGTPPRMSYHVQFEPRLSLTGSKADQRFALAPADIGLLLSHLASRVAHKAGVALPAEDLEAAPVSASFLDHLAETLWQSRERCLLLCGSQDVNVQVLVNFLHHLLGCYGSTVDAAEPSYQAQGNDGDVAALLEELRDGRVGALFIHGCNPVHDLPGGAALAEHLRGVPLLVACCERLDETASLARFVCPVPHYLESWSDAEPVNGIVSLAQPALEPLGETRSLMESLTSWMTAAAGQPPKAREILRTTWEAEVFPRCRERDTFAAFWDRTLHDGMARVAPRPVRVGVFNQSAVRLIKSSSRPPAGVYTLVLYSKVSLPDSAHAYNPWLHELPDPISKVTWDNYACLSPAAAAELGVEDGDVVRLEVEGNAAALEVPAFVQPGQHDRVVAVALGYGSRLSARFADIGPPWIEAHSTVGDDGLVGKNAAPFLTWLDGTLRPERSGVRLVKTGQRQALASTQAYHQIAVPAHLRPTRQPLPIIHETTLTSLTGRSSPARQSLPVVPAEGDLWPDDHPAEGTRWGMVIDHNACTGCSACVIACQVENNIPVVGKDEVRRHREMHWLRIDRYYAERDGSVDVVHQPMLCQHCGNAPCEVVCPVLATVHSSEGLNQQVYNRCVGTRYCANNCPYKVRRFNWFDYAHDDALQNLSLNPDVTVRSRGVMEKCTFCVQRIQNAKAEAARQGLPLRDGDVQTACQQSCPAQAITFGNLNDPRSRVARSAADPRAYRVLEELNVRPAVNYLTLVRNRPVNAEGQAHG